MQYTVHSLYCIFLLLLEGAPDSQYGDLWEPFPWVIFIHVILPGSLWETPLLGKDGVTLEPLKKEFTGKAILSHSWQLCFPNGQITTYMSKIVTTSRKPGFFATNEQDMNLFHYSEIN